MRHFVLGALLAGAASACGPTRPADQAVPSATRAVANRGAEAESLFLDVALVEVTPGDAFVSHELWDLGDEQCVALDVKPALEDNGLRVCQVGGLLPERLQALLSARRSCPSPRRLRAEFDKPTPVQVGPRRGRMSFQLRAGGSEREVELVDARCLLEVVPASQEDGTLRLRFLPRVQHGKARVVPEVARDAGGALRWAMEAREPVEDFPEVRWEMTLGANEYVVVGARAGAEGTLGDALFLTEESGAPRQLLLVLRAARVGGPREPVGHVPPVAMRAGWGQARGTSR